MLNIAQLLDLYKGLAPLHNVLLLELDVLGAVHYENSGVVLGSSLNLFVDCLRLLNGLEISLVDNKERHVTVQVHRSFDLLGGWHNLNAETASHEKEH